MSLVAADCWSCALLLHWKLDLPANAKRHRAITPTQRPIRKHQIAYWLPCFCSSYNANTSELIGTIRSMWVCPWNIFAPRLQKWGTFLTMSPIPKSGGHVPSSPASCTPGHSVRVTMHGRWSADRRPERWQQQAEQHSSGTPESCARNWLLHYRPTTKFELDTWAHGRIYGGRAWLWNEKIILGVLIGSIGL